MLRRCERQHNRRRPNLYRVKIISNGFTHDAPDSVDGPLNSVTVWISTENSPEWKGPIPFDIDSDASCTVITQDTLDALQMKLSPVAEIENENANGKIDRNPLMLINLKIQTVGSQGTVDFIDLPVSITKGTTNLLGMSVLQYFSVYLKNGVLVELVFDEKSVQSKRTSSR